MPATYTNAQVQGTGNSSTYATLCSTAGGTTAVISSIVICNRSTTAATYRIAITTTAGTPSAGQFLVYDSAIAGNDTVSLSLGITLDASEFIRISSSTNTLDFTAFMSVIS